MWIKMDEKGLKLLEPICTKIMDVSEIHLKTLYILYIKNNYLLIHKLYICVLLLNASCPPSIISTILL